MLQPIAKWQVYNVLGMALAIPQGPHSNNMYEDTTHQQDLR